MSELDPGIAGMLEHLRTLGLPDMGDLPVPAIRAALTDNCRTMEGPPPAMPVRVRPLSLTGVAGALEGRLYRLVDGEERPCPAILYFHGGGFVSGGLDSHDMVCRRLAALSGLPVLAATYRLAPENPLPAAHDDALSILAQIGREGGSWGLATDQLVIAGDSAGANIALATALDRPGDGPAVVGVLLFYPVISFDRDFPSRAKLGRDYLLTERSMQAFNAMALPDAAGRGQPRFNFLNRDGMGHCPPVMLLTAGYDPLRDEGQALADRLRSDGVALTHHHCPTLIHAFVHMTGITPAIQPLLSQAADWCRQRLIVRILGV